MKIDLNEIVAAGTHFWIPEDLPRLLGKFQLLRATLLVIGKSRESRPIYGLRIGRGKRRLSLLAGAHADEPVGPAALFSLARWLIASKHADPLLENATFLIIPNLNPDGTHRNSSWASKEDYTLEEYLRGVNREEPGDDLEYAFPVEAGTKCRPEARAVADFLRHQGPFAFHASLHGMAIGEGAWYLLNSEKIDATADLRRVIAAVTRDVGIGLHDWDREGEKGFTRIEPGFCTTPTSVAMREHFERQKLWSVAEKFLPSSMEFVASLGGDPLLMVSEIPLFLVHPSPPDASVPGQNFLEAKKRLLSSSMQLASGNHEPLEKLKARFGLVRLEHPRAVKLQLAMVLLGSELVTRDDLDI